MLRTHSLSLLSLRRALTVTALLLSTACGAPPASTWHLRKKLGSA